MKNIEINPKDNERVYVHLYSSDMNDFYSLEIKTSGVSKPLNKLHARAYETPLKQNKRKIIEFTYGIDGRETRKEDINELENITGFNIKKIISDSSPANKLVLSFPENTEIHTHYL